MKKSVTAILVVALVLSGLVMLVIRQARQGKTTVPVSNETAGYVRLQQPALFTPWYVLGSVENAVSWRWIEASSTQLTPNARAASR